MESLLKVLLMKVLLRTMWPLEKHAEILLDRFPFVIGRRNDNDCVLPLAFISRHHCRFLRSGDQVLVQDLESYNGTFVNGTRITAPKAIHSGDELSLGPCSFRVQILGATGETPVQLSSATAKQPAIEPDGSDDQFTVRAQV